MLLMNQLDSRFYKISFSKTQRDRKLHINKYNTESHNPRFNNNH